MRIAAMMLAALTYSQGVTQWRADYEASLKAPGGWLNVTGLFWLHEGENVVGSDPLSDVVLPAGLPTHAGVLTFRAGSIAWAGKALKADSGESAQVGSVSMSIIVRGGRTAVRLRDSNAETLRHFTGCKWYPVDEKWRVAAKWTAYNPAKKLTITNVLGMTMQQDSPGFAEFTIAGENARLEPTVEDGRLFFTFKDRTSGSTTYGAGRFLYAAMPVNGTVELDFNKAENPPCAFTAFATCPLPPKHNTISFAVEAGEKKYGKH